MPNDGARPTVQARLEVESPALVERLARERAPLTVCPLSNVKLCVFESLDLEASFAPAADKARWIERLDAVFAS